MGAQQSDLYYQYIQMMADLKIKNPKNMINLSGLKIDQIYLDELLDIIIRTNDFQRKSTQETWASDSFEGWHEAIILTPESKILKDDFINVILTQWENKQISKVEYDEFMAKIPLINFNAPAERAKLLQYYIEIFNEIPSGSHMIRAYNLMEKIFLEKYKNAQITVDEKAIEKFDKLKTLSLGNENVNERKTAFYMSVKQYIKIADVKLEIPER